MLPVFGGSCANTYSLSNLPTCPTGVMFRCAPMPFSVLLGTLLNSLMREMVGAGMATFTTSTIIHAPREEVWAVLADIGSIHSWNPGVEHSHTTTEKDSGLGASRHCDLGGRNYLEEEVVEYEQGEKLTMRVTDSNLPFAHANIRFFLEPEETSTRVILQPDYELKFGLVGELMDRLFVRRSYEKGMQALLRGLKRHVESEVQTPDRLVDLSLPSGLCDPRGDAIDDASHA